MKLDDNTDFFIEKNQTINAGVGVKGNPTACMPVPKLDNSNITLSDFFNNAVNKFGASEIFDYDMENRNCQRFVTALLVANGCDYPRLRAFTNQNISGAITNDLIRTGVKVGIKLAEGASMIIGKAKDLAHKLFNIG